MKNMFQIHEELNRGGCWGVHGLANPIDLVILLLWKRAYAYDVCKCLWWLWCEWCLLFEINIFANLLALLVISLGEYFCTIWLVDLLGWPWRYLDLIYNGPTSLTGKAICFYLSFSNGVATPPNKNRVRDWVVRYAWDKHTGSRMHIPSFCIKNPGEVWSFIFQVVWITYICKHIRIYLLGQIA